MITIENHIKVDDMLTQKAKEELHRLSEKYEIGYNILCKLYIQGLTKGFSSKTSLIGIRLALSTDSDKEEYFSIDDVVELTGLTREEAEKEMIKSGRALKITYLE